MAKKISRAPAGKPKKRGPKRRPLTRRGEGEPPEVDRAAIAQDLIEKLDCPPWFAEQATAEDFDEVLGLSISPEQRLIDKGYAWIAILSTLIRNETPTEHDRELLLRAEKTLEGVPLVVSAGLGLNDLPGLLGSYHALKMQHLSLSVAVTSDDPRAAAARLQQDELSARIARVEAYFAAIGRAMDDGPTKTLVERKQDDLDIAFNVQMGRRLLTDAHSALLQLQNDRPSLEEVQAALWREFQEHLTGSWGISIEGSTTNPLVTALAAGLSAAIADRHLYTRHGDDRQRLPFVDIAIDATAEVLDLDREAVRQRNKRVGELDLSAAIQLVPQA